MKSVTLLQWNVESSEPFENICSYLDEHRPDIACLQELTIDSAVHGRRDGPKYIAEQLGYQYCQVELPNIAPDGNDVCLSNAILVNGRILNSRKAVLSKPASNLGFESQSRGYVEGAVSVRDETLTVGTTHLGYSHRFEMTDRRKTESDELIRQIAPNRERFILAGDFNAEPESYVVNSIARRLTSAGPSHDCPTWTTKPFSYQGFAADQLQWRLDYVFVSDDINVLSSDILKSRFSDHLPILCAIELPAS
jgi:endonuclease/exonuclease/phosphatase family metal-dependent hydrolase